MLCVLQVQPDLMPLAENVKMKISHLFSHVYSGNVEPVTKQLGETVKRAKVLWKWSFTPHILVIKQAEMYKDTLQKILEMFKWAERYIPLVDILNNKDIRKWYKSYIIYLGEIHNALLMLEEGFTKVKLVERVIYPGLTVQIQTEQGEDPICIIENAKGQITLFSEDVDELLTYIDGPKGCYINLKLENFRVTQENNRLRITGHHGMRLKLNTQGHIDHFLQTLKDYEHIWG